MRVEIQMKHGHLPWAKREQASQEINLWELYDYYWSSKGHKFALPGESLSEFCPLISDGEAQRSLLLESIVSL